MGEGAMAGPFDALREPLALGLVLRQLERRPPRGDPHLEAGDRTNEPAEVGGLHLVARPGRIFADPCFVVGRKDVALRDEFADLKSVVWGQGGSGRVGPGW